MEVCGLVGRRSPRTGGAGAARPAACRPAAGCGCRRRSARRGGNRVARRSSGWSSSPPSPSPCSGCAWRGPARRGRAPSSRRGAAPGRGRPGLSAGAAPVGVPRGQRGDRSRRPARRRRPSGPRGRPWVRQEPGRHPGWSSSTSSARCGDRGCCACPWAPGWGRPSRRRVGRPRPPTSAGSTSRASSSTASRCGCRRRVTRSTRRRRRGTGLGTGGVAPVGPAGGLVSLNTADLAALDTLPGVGPVLASRIVEWRTCPWPVLGGRRARGGERHRREAPRAADPARHAVTAPARAAGATGAAGGVGADEPPGRPPRVPAHSDLRLLGPAVLAWVVAAATLGLTARGHLAVAGAAAVVRGTAGPVPVSAARPAAALAARARPRPRAAARGRRGSARDPARTRRGRGARRRPCSGHRGGPRHRRPVRPRRSGRRHACPARRHGRAPRRPRGAEGGRRTGAADRRRAASQRLEWRSTVRVHGRLGPAERADDRVATLAVTGTPEVITPPGAVASGAERLRSGLRASVDSAPADARGLLPGLVIGDTSRTPADLTEAMRATGMTHLTAVSGSNVAVVTGLVLALCVLLGVPRRARPVLALVALAGFVVLARPEPSVVRAAAMGAIGLLGLSRSRRSAGLPVLGAAIVVVLALDPWLARSFGFALSSVATLGLLLFTRPWGDAIGARLPRSPGPARTRARGARGGPADDRAPRRPPPGVGQRGRCPREPPRGTARPGGDRRRGGRIAHLGGVATRRRARRVGRRRPDDRDRAARPDVRPRARWHAAVARRCTRGPAPRGARPGRRPHRAGDRPHGGDPSRAPSRRRPPRGRRARPHPDRHLAPGGVARRRVRRGAGRRRRRAERPAPRRPRRHRSGPPARRRLPAPAGGHDPRRGRPHPLPRRPRGGAERCCLRASGRAAVRRAGPRTGTHGRRSRPRGEGARHPRRRPPRR